VITYLTQNSSEGVFGYSIANVSFKDAHWLKLNVVAKSYLLRLRAAIQCTINHPGFNNGDGKNYFYALMRLVSTSSSALSQNAYQDHNNSLKDRFRIHYYPYSGDIGMETDNLSNHSGSSPNSSEIKGNRAPDFVLAVDIFDDGSANKDARRVVMIGEVKRSDAELNTAIKQVISYAYGLDRFTSRIVDNIPLILITGQHFFIGEFKHGMNYEEEHIVFQKYYIGHDVQNLNLKEHDKFLLKVADIMKPYL